MSSGAGLLSRVDSCKLERRRKNFFQACKSLFCIKYFVTSIIFRFDTVVDAALGFLSAICMRPQYSSMFEVEGVLKTLCEDVIIKNLMLRECDIELFDEEPLEYIKRDIEGLLFAVNFLEIISHFCF